MDISIAASQYTTIQYALNVISLLQLTSYRYPQEALVEDGSSFDYIIVGAGAAGCVVANRLTEDPGVSVLLIEAGGDPPLESLMPGTSSYTLNSRLDWNYTSAGCNFDCHLNNKIKIHKGKALGGSSSINSMFYVRGNPHDYDDWARISDDDSWSYENILQYFIRSERLTDQALLNSSTANFHGTKGYIGVSIQHTWEEELDVIGALEEIGHTVNVDTNSDKTLGYAPAQYTVADGIRQSTSNTYLSDAKQRPNLYVLKNYFVTKINIENKVAVSVIAMDENGKEKTLKANREIIVSGGAFNSPQLLMLSGIGPKEHLEQLGIEVIADLPVGENLHDHKFTTHIYTLGDADVTLEPATPHEVAVPVIIGFGALNKSQDYPDYQSLIYLASDMKSLQLCSFSYEFNDDICQSFYERSKGKNVLFVGQILLHPKTIGRVLLKSRDPLEYPLIKIDAFTEDADFEDQIKYNKEFAKFVDTTFFKSVGGEFLELEKCASLGIGSDEYWRCHTQCMVTPMYHQIGTCAMGTVVDSRLRVKDVQKLRVVDTSVMPTITSGNTYAPTIMIAEKAADMIKEDNASRALA